MHTISISEIQTKLDTDPKTGLTNEDAKNRIATYGLNEIEQSQDTSILTIVLRQFKSPIVFLLLFAIGLSFAYSKWGDAIAILVVLLVNTCIGFFMEFKAERSMNALRRLTNTAAKVIRNGILFETTTTELVPGDLLYLEAGDIIPADARIVDAFQLQVNESALTGESIPSEYLSYRYLK